MHLNCGCLPPSPRKSRRRGGLHFPREGGGQMSRMVGREFALKKREFFQANESVLEEIISKEALSEGEPCKTLDVPIKTDECQPRWA